MAATVSGATGADAPGRPAQRSADLGATTYRLPDNWAFINARCADDDKACKAKAVSLVSSIQDSAPHSRLLINSQVRLQCVKDPCLSGRSAASWDFEACAASPGCRTEMERFLSEAQAAAAGSASLDPDQRGEEAITNGNREIAAFLDNKDTAGSSFSILSMTPDQKRSSRDITITAPDTLSLTNTGSKKGGGITVPDSDSQHKGGSDPSLDYARDKLSGPQDGQDPGLIGGIVRYSPFLNDHMFVASNTSGTDLSAMRRVGSDVLNPIHAAFGDGASGRTAFDGQSTDLPKDVQQRKCGTNFFGSENCKQ